MTAISFAPDGAAAAPSLDDLPTWRLEDLYSGMDDPALARDLDEIEAAAGAFAEKYEGKLAGLDGAAFGAAVQEIAEGGERLSRVLSFAYLVYADNVADPERTRFLQAMQERATQISAHTLFFTLELNRLDDAVLDAKLADPATAKFKSWIETERTFKPYQLSDEQEKLLHEKEVTGRSSWKRLYDETFAELRFTMGDDQLTSTEVLDRMLDPDAATRKHAALAFSDGLTDNIRLFTHITNVLAKDWGIESNWRGYANPWTARNLSNQVEDEVVDALVASVQDAYPRLSHRYYKMKAQWFGVDRLDFWDRNAPLPDSDDRRFGWDEAKDAVLTAYGSFSSDMEKVGRRFFDERWIDAPARPGKASGAFAHPTVTTDHPFILLNYLGRTNDVMTLAHELGHGVHQVLAGKQGPLLADTPLTLAETASVFGEMLTFRSLLDATENKVARKAMLANKVESMLNTVVRQIAFYQFEQRVHAGRQKAELSTEELNGIWMDVQTESLGPSIRLDEPYKVYWSYIPHFIHSPFYVYAYAFGDCLVNSLYAAYLAKPEGFADQYMEMLAAGGTKRHKELLAPFGLDATAPSFWQGGLSVVEGLINELEEVADA